MNEYDVDKWLRGRMKKRKSQRAPDGFLVIADGVFPSPPAGESRLEEVEAWSWSRLYGGSTRISAVVSG